MDFVKQNQLPLKGLVFLMAGCKNLHDRTYKLSLVKNNEFEDKINKKKKKKVRNENCVSAQRWRKTEFLNTQICRKCDRCVSLSYRLV